jgi:hypothetical protein
VAPPHFGEILAFAPTPQPSGERVARRFLVLKVRRPCSVSHAQACYTWVTYSNKTNPEVDWNRVVVPVSDSERCVRDYSVRGCDLADLSGSGAHEADANGEKNAAAVS